MLELKLEPDSASHALVWSLKKNHQHANYFKPDGDWTEKYIGKITQSETLKEKTGLERLPDSNLGSSKLLLVEWLW